MWVKLDDHFVDHPKIVAAGPMAGWLFVAGLCYANRLLTDGFIPENQVTRLVTVNGHGNVINLIDKLCAVGLWSRVVLDGKDGETGKAKGFMIHDFLEYQPSRKKVLKTRQKTTKRQARWRKNATRKKTTSSRGSNGVT